MEPQAKRVRLKDGEDLEVEEEGLNIHNINNVKYSIQDIEEVERWADLEESIRDAFRKNNIKWEKFPSGQTMSQKFFKVYFAF